MSESKPVCVECGSTDLFPIHGGLKCNDCKTEQDYNEKKKKNTKTCQRCKSDRILEIQGKTSDLCWARFKGKGHEGYVPRGIGVDDGTGDYLEFDFCLQCGQIQGKFPIRKNPKF